MCCLYARNSISREWLAGARGKTHVYESETSSFWSDQAASPCKTLSSQDTLPFLGLGLVGAEEVTDFAAANTDITSWHIGIGTNVLAQLAHESNAELADLIIRLALGIEICSSLSTTNVHCIQILAS
jgi:hypothetical protein